MGEDLLTTLSMENHHPSTLLSMDSSAASSHDECERELNRSVILSRPPDINLPFSAERSPHPPSWSLDMCDILDVSLGSQIYENDALLSLPKVGRKCAKRGESIWGAWFFFNNYFKPVLNEKSKGKITLDSTGLSGFDKSDLRLDVFLVQHDMENLYMWAFKERPENALGKMQLRSYMNGHSRLGEPQFPFSVDKGFVRSHRMQRKQYRGLSNPQCVHGIEVVRSPNLSGLPELDRRKWAELTGRELNFTIAPDAVDFASWRNLSNPEFELERPPPPLKGISNQHSKKSLNGSGVNLSNQSSNQANGDGMELSPLSNKRRKDFFLHGNDDDCSLPINSLSNHVQDIEMQPTEPSWMHDFSGVMRDSYGPVTAAKSIYEDEEGYLILVSLPLIDLQKVKVSWKNTSEHGIVKVHCVSTARPPFVNLYDRTFKLTDPSPEHCPPGEFVREISLASRIPEDGKLEAYYDGTTSILEILVPKLRVGLEEEHEVHVCLRSQHGAS